MSTDQARALLECVLPALPGDAYLNIHWTYVSKRDGKVYWGGRACKTVAEAVDAVVFANRSPATRDVYFCTSAQMLAEKKVVGAHSFLAPIRNQQNAVRLRSLFIDVDVKEGAYPDQRAALTALIDFVRSAGLPRPNAIVSSGSGGLHIYWALDQDLGPAEWQPMADALAEATRRHQLLCDTACTVDSARVLRVPGTLNRKKDPPAEVRLLAPPGAPISTAAMRMALGPYMGAKVIPLRPNMATAALGGLAPGAGTSQGTQINDDLSAGVQAARIVNLPALAPECGFIREALDTGGAAYNRNLWHLTTLLATFAENGQALAHDMAKGHPGYDPAQTESFYQQKLQEKASKNIGWPSCQTVQNAGCGHCATCPHFAAGKSPLNIIPAPPKAQVQDDVPSGYMRDASGMIHISTLRPDGATEWKQVVSFAIEDGFVQNNPYTLHFSTRDLLTGAARSVALGFADIASATELPKRILAQGCAYQPDRTKDLQRFLMSYIERLQSMKNRAVDTRPFGWFTHDGALAGFAYGGVAYSPLGPEKSVPAARIFAQNYTPTGKIDAWRDALAVVCEQQRPALDAILAASFGAPLVRLLGQSGAVVSARGESGVGKSTAAQVGQAVWGAPQGGAARGHSTQNQLEDQMGELRELPVYVDELQPGEEDKRRVVQFLLNTSGGQGKGRLNRDGSQRQAKTWNTLMVVTSNGSLLDYAMRHSPDSTATAYRIFEFDVEQAPKTRTLTDVDAVIGALKDNYGNAGRIYAEALGRNPQQIAAIAQAVKGRLESALQATTEERLWLMSMASMVAGAMIARKLALVPFDIPSLEAFLSDHFQRMRGLITRAAGNLSSPEILQAVLAQYVRDAKPRGYLETASVPLTAKPGRPAKLDPRNDVTRLEKVIVHYGVDDGQLLFPAQHFESWLVDNGRNPALTVAKMCQSLGMREVPRATPGMGTGLAAFIRERCYLIDVTRAGITGGDGE